MEPISTTFTRAARATNEADAHLSVFWLMVLAIAILDDSARREKDRRNKCNPSQPANRPKGPRPF